MTKIRIKRPPARSYGSAPILEKEDIHALEEVLARHCRRSERLKRLALLHLGLGSGMRCGEMLLLTVEDVVSRVDSKGHPILRDSIALSAHVTKTRKSRLVDITPQAKKHLESWLQYLVSELKFKGENYIFFNRRNRRHPMTIRSARNMFHTWGRQIGMDRLSTHSMRRTHATFLRRIGADIKLIKEQLGHASLAYTDRYLSIDPKEKARKIAELSF